MRPIRPLRIQEDLDQELLYLQIHLKDNRYQILKILDHKQEVIEAPNKDEVLSCSTV